MWDQDWALLGIEPTTELAAIKKAYALKLKTTRPDDDADAYQALRGAYERVQQWVKWQASAGTAESTASQSASAEPAPAISTAPATADAVADVTAAAPSAEPGPRPALAAADMAPPPTRPVTPQELIESLELAWRRGGEAALWTAWHEARARLDEQPLRLRAEFSAQFARWVLRLPQLPNAFVAMLNRHFSWLDDFRVEREIGSDLVQALHDELDSRLLRPINDPGALQLADPLLRFNAHRRQGPWLPNLAFAIVLQPLLARTLQQLGTRLIRRLGVPAGEREALRELTIRAAWLRFALLALGYYGVSAARGGLGGETLLRVISWVVTTLLIFGTTVLIGGLINTGLGLVMSRRIGRLLQGWRQHRRQPLLGIGLMLFVAALAYFDVKADALLMHPSSLAAGGNSGGWLLPTLLGMAAFAGLLLAWPQDAGHGFVCVGLSPLVCSLFALWLLPSLPLTTSLLLSLAWMLAAAGVREGRLPAPGLLEWPFRPMLNSFMLVDRWGLTTAMLPLFCAFAYAMLPGPRPGGAGLFLTWVLSNLALIWLQSRGETWALARLSRA